MVTTAPTYATDMYSTPGYLIGYDAGYGYGYPSYGYGYSGVGYSLGYGLGYGLGYSYGTPYTVNAYNPGPTVVTTPSNQLSITYSPTTITDSGNTTNSGNTTSTYTSTTNVTNTTDSHNVVNIDSHNVTTVSQATPQYLAQAYLPSYPYPSYYPSYSYTYSYPYSYSAAPSCTISASQGANGQILLTWYSANATSAYISPAVGSVSPSGSTFIYPYGNSLYTLSVSGNGGTATCQTSAYYSAVSTVSTASYTTPAAPAPTTAPYVALTQIPYTGFDYGPVGDAVYWFALLSFAIAGAYLTVYYLPTLKLWQAGRGGALSLATAVIRRKETSAGAKSIAYVVAPVAHAEHSNEDTHAKQAYAGVRDVMTLVPSKNGLAPRIVISRC